MGALNPIYKPLGHISLLSEVTTMSNSNLQHRSTTNVATGNTLDGVSGKNNF